jgi:hypothetical protein
MVPLKNACMYVKHVFLKTVCICVTFSFSVFNCKVGRERYVRMSDRLKNFVVKHVYGLSQDFTS